MLKLTTLGKENFTLLKNLKEMIPEASYTAMEIIENYPEYAKTSKFKRISKYTIQYLKDKHLIEGE